MQLLELHPLGARGAVRQLRQQGQQGCQFVRPFPGRQQSLPAYHHRGQQRPQFLAQIARPLRDRRRAPLQLRERPLQAGPGLRAAVKFVPGIALQLYLRSDVVAGGLHGGAPVQYHPIPVQSARLQLPKHQDPALGIDGQGAFAGPNRAAVDIDHVHIGPSAVVGGDLIQGQGAHRRRGGRWVCISRIAR